MKRKPKSKHPDAVRSDNYRKKNADNNRCVHCPAERVPGKTMCAAHCAYTMIQSTKRRAEERSTDRFVVYGLADPHYSEIATGFMAEKYVGSAQNLEARIRSHYAERATRNTPLSAWLIELEAEGLEPLITIHQLCYTRGGAEKAEGEWIVIMRRLKAELFNESVPTGKRKEIGGTKIKVAENVRALYTEGSDAKS